MKGVCRLTYIAIIALIHASLQVPIVHAETLDCLIEPYVVVHVGSAVEGVLNTVTVDRGDLVKKGQVLARLESSTERATVARFRAKAAVEAPIKIKQVRLELSTLQHSRSEGLYQKTIIADDEMDEAETNKRLAELNLLEAVENQRLAELDLQRVIAELNRRTIRSPVNGVVVERLRHPGEFSDENPILKLAQMHPLRVEVFAPVELLGQMEGGMRAEVMPEPPVGGVHEARVTTVDRVVDAASGMLGVRLELPNRSYRLPAGLKCQVRFQFPSDQRAQESGPLSAPSSQSRPVPVVDTVKQGETASGVSPTRRAQEPGPLSVSSSQSHLAPAVGRVKQGETASGLFRRAGIGIAKVLKLQEAIRAVYDIRHVLVGHPYSIQVAPDGRLQRFTYQIDMQHQLEVERHHETFIGHLEPIPYS